MLHTVCQHLDGTPADFRISQALIEMRKVCMEGEGNNPGRFVVIKEVVCYKVYEMVGIKKRPDPLVRPLAIAC